MQKSVTAILPNLGEMSLRWSRGSQDECLSKGYSVIQYTLPVPAGSTVAGLWKSEVSNYRNPSMEYSST